MRERPASLWHYAPLLPVDARQHVSLGEGATPLLEAPRLAKRLDLGSLLLKWEGANPTGSFKDRQIAVAVSHAREKGRHTVAAVSSGNVAAATAAYAARAGMRAVLFMHAHASLAKMAQAALAGSRIIRVDSDAPSAVFDLCIQACERFGWGHVSTAGMYNPWNVEGAKTIAYELWQQTEGNLPEWIVVPVGGGGLLGGIWRGLLDLQRLGLITRMPRLCGVQPEGCAVLKRAITRRETFLESIRNPWPSPKTIAGGLADDILFDGHTALPAIRETQGCAITVTDGEMEQAVASLAQWEGLGCELCSAVTVAALPELRHGESALGEVCCVLTGTALKDMPRLSERLSLDPPVPPSLSAVATLLRD